MIVIDYSDKHPIYEQIVERFRKLILSGALGSNERLPSVRAMAIELSINPNTIQRAYTELERRGYIYSVKGKGSFVCNDVNTIVSEKEKMLSHLEELLNSYKEIGIEENEIEKSVMKVYRKGNGDD